MRKVLTITDLHVSRPGRLMSGLDPMERLGQVLDRLIADHADADRLVIMGDLVNWGGVNEYERLKPVLDGLPWPVHLMIGNHDNRDAFQQVFADAARTDAGHVQEVIDMPGWRLVTLDSFDETYTAPIGSGILCDARLAWLDTALAGAGDRRVALFIHHPPITTFFTGMDELGLRNRDALHDLITRHGNVDQIIAGHLHRTMAGTWRGYPVMTFKGTCHQSPLKIGDLSVTDGVVEPAAYGILLFNDEGVTIHSQDVT